MKEIVPVQQKVVARNDELAARLAELFAARHIYVFNMLSSPGSGKTSLLERLLPRLSPHLRCGVIEGDVQTENDARRIARVGAPVRQIITCGTCHLDAQMILDHVGGLPLDALDVIFIENVGNLVCPSSYWLGENARMVILSTTEGDDKPAKYPAVFRKADLLVINKIDLGPHTDFDMDQAVRYARGLNPDLAVFPVSCRTGEGLDDLVAKLAATVRDKQDSSP